MVFCFVVVVMLGLSAAAGLGKSAKLSSETSADYSSTPGRNPSMEREDNEPKQHDGDTDDDVKDVLGTFFERFRTSTETAERPLNRMRRNVNSTPRKLPKKQRVPKPEKTSQGSQLNAIQLQADDRNGYYSRMTGESEVGALISWKPVTWCENKTSRFFRFDANNGSIHILQSGLYYIYAQITYMNLASLNKYEVRVDGDILFSCVQERRFVSSTRTSESPVLENCHAGSVAWLQADKRVSIWEANEFYRRMDLTSHATFWGIMRAGN